MSGREQAAETEKTVVPGITKKAKYRIFILAVLIAGVLTGVVTTRMHAGSKGEVVQSSGAYGGRGFAVPCAGK